MDAAWAVLFVLVAAGIVGWLVYANTPGNLKFESALGPPELLEGAVIVFTSEGWTTTTRTSTQVTFVRESRPSCCLALLLAVILIIPAVVYMILWRATYTASVSVADRRKASVVLVSWNRRHAGQQVASRFSNAARDMEDEGDADATRPQRGPSVSEACPACGAPVTSQQKFCPECGGRLL